MKVVIRCVNCSFLNEDTETFTRMNPIGPCVVNDQKDQYQDYMCPLCFRITNVMINTIKEQADLEEGQ